MGEAGMLAPPPPSRKLDTVSLEGLDDLVDPNASERCKVKSRDFPELYGSDYLPADVDFVMFDSFSEDSFAACWAARSAHCRNSPIFYGANRSTTVASLDDVASHRVVAIVGLGLPDTELHELLEECKWVFILVNYVSVARELETFTHPKLVKIVELEMSAAALAWNFFRPGVPVPALLRAIEDAELGRRALRDSEAFELGLLKEPLYPPRGQVSFGDESFCKFTEMVGKDGGKDTIEKYATSGRQVESEFKLHCAQAVGKRRLRTLRKFPAWRCASAEFQTPYRGAVAEWLLKELVSNTGSGHAVGDASAAPHAGGGPDEGGEVHDGHKRPLDATARCFSAVFEIQSQRVFVVLRSLPGGPDVSEIAASFDGCGYPTRGFFSVDLNVWETEWIVPEPVLWSFDSQGPNCLPLTRGDSVYVVARGQRFRGAPFDEWSYGYIINDNDTAAGMAREGWFPSLAHTLLVATCLVREDKRDIQGLEEGDLLVPLGQRGQYLWGCRFRGGCKDGDGWQKGWFLKGDALQPVQPAAAARVVVGFEPWPC